MTRSLVDSLAIYSPFLPAALVEPSALDRVCTVARWLPAQFTGWVYLECRLQRESSGIDLIVELGEAGRDILCGRNPVYRLDDAIMAEPAWQRVRAACEVLEDPASAAYDRAGSMWLEFDAGASAGEQTAGAPPIPGLFINLETVAGFSSNQWLRIAMAGLAPLFGGALDDSTARTLRRCIERLPSPAGVAYVGVMLQRDVPTLRLCIMRLAHAELPRYLTDIGWNGAVGAVDALGRQLGSALPLESHGPTLLHLDIAGGSIIPRAGLEYTLARRPQVAGRLDERALFDELVTAGLCVPAKRDALWGWPGYSYETFPHEFWRSLVVRRVNHIKVVYDANRAVEAKAYLCGFPCYPRARGPEPVS